MHIKKEKLLLNTKKDILFVTTEIFFWNGFEFDIYPGGLAHYIYKIASILVSLGHHVTIVCVSSQTGLTFTGNVFFIQKKVNNLTVFFLNVDAYFDSFCNCFKNSKTVLKNWNSYRFSYSCYMFLKYQNSKKIDVIQYSSTLGIGLFPLLNIPSCIRISSNRKRWIELNNATYNCFQDLEFQALKQHPNIYGPSQFIINSILQDLNIQKKISVIETPYDLYEPVPNYIIYNQFYTTFCRRNSSYLLFFGQIKYLKGISEIGEILYSLLKKYSSLKFVFIGPERSHGLLTNFLKASAGVFSERVIIYEEMQSNELLPFIQNALAVVLPSRIDNFPNTAIETLRQKKCLITSDTAGLDQLLENGKDAILYSYKKPYSLFDSIDKFLNLPKNKQIEMGNNGYNKTKRLHPYLAGQRLISYFDSIISAWDKVEKNFSYSIKDLFNN